MAKLPPINFEALAKALLDRAEALCSEWLSGGVKRGHEWVCGDLSGGPGSSCSVNLNTGAWADFAGDDRGSDLISLYACIHSLGPGEAAIELARAHGLEDEAGLVKQAPGTPAVVRAPRPPPPPPKPKQQEEKWATQIPVPPHAPHPRFEHHHRTSADVVFTSAYMVDGFCMGYVVRFRTSEGGKDDLPYTWCVSESKGGAMWRWRTWDEPRPLYYPGGKSIKAVQGDRPEPPTVIVVEGERKGRVLQALLDAHAPGVYVVVSWPGGCKVWAKAMWDWLEGCTVILWPDCDSQRERLTSAELKQYTDPSAKALAQATKPFLPKDKQPGWKAMLGLGQMLQADFRCKVQILPVAEPGEKADGWDAADAIEKDGWDFARVLEYFGQAGPVPMPDGRGVQTPAPAEKSSAPAADAGNGGGGGKKPPKDDDDVDDDYGVGGADDDDFTQHLRFMCQQMRCKVWGIKVTRKLVISALRKSPLLSGCVGFNELTEGPETREAWPWRKAASPMIDSDPLRLGDFLSEHYRLPGASKASLEEAIDTVADENRFHPVRDWLDGLQHDGKSRIDQWLIYVLRLKADELKPGLRRYLELVGRYMLLGLVARVLKPGCKFDYTPVLEGKGGLGKSTLIKVLVGDKFFSDTHFEIGSGKDAYEQLAGIWGYELSEMTALQRADSEQSKQFLSSTEDRYRGAYGRYVVAHPRQCVIFCSTNKYQYLRDLSGNRRYWPFVVQHRPDLDWLTERREQLFAEAVALFKAGGRIYPTPEEEDEFFVPEQRKRLMETAVQARLWRLLTRVGPWPGEAKATAHLKQDTKFVSIDEMVEALGTDSGKSSAQLENQIRSWLESMGWTAAREGGGLRRRGFRRPAEWPPAVLDDDDSVEAGGGQAQQGDGEPGAGEPSVEGADGAPF